MPLGTLLNVHYLYKSLRNKMDVHKFRIQTLQVKFRPKRFSSQIVPAKSKQKGQIGRLAACEEQAINYKMLRPYL